MEEKNLNKEEKQVGVRPAAFLLIKTDLNAFKVVNSVRNCELVEWANVVYGPYQVVVYVEGNSDLEVAEFIEDLRSRRYIVELDARMVKALPKDIELKGFEIRKSKLAVLLINVNYKEEKERIVTYNLRNLNGVKWARAMWGPTDIIAIVEADDHESMRDLICDEVKISKGVKTNSTLFGYP